MILIKKEEFNNRDSIEMADFLLHKRTFDEFKNLKIDKNAKILLLGCGKGAFEEKLIDGGYNSLTAVDINEKDYIQNKNVNFLRWDLNRDFRWENDKYDVIFAIELIEHLESTAHFIGECNKVLETEGFLILTTPNVLEKASKINLLLFGRHHSFDETALDDYGHLNPIFPHILMYYAEKNHFSLIKKTYNRDYFDFLIIHSWKSYPYYVFIRLFFFFLKLINVDEEESRGVINIYVFRKKPHQKEI